MPSLPQPLSRRSNLCDQLLAFFMERDSAGLMVLSERMVERQYAHSWHHARLSFVQKYWREDDVSALLWLRAELGPQLWKGLTIPSWWTLNKNDALRETRLEWHREMLTFNDARGVFKSDPRSIELFDHVPKLSWLIAAMQAAKPRAYPWLDTYFPGAFSYYQLLQSMGENPMNNSLFTAWILEGKHPGFSESLENIDQHTLFGSCD